MKTELPTKPGPYYWRESDGGEWEIAQINRCMDVYFVGCDMHYGLKKTGGEWLPIPTAEELVELQSAKKMVDESREQWQIWNPCHSKLEMVGRTEDEAITAFRKSIKSNNPPEPWSQFLAAGYTCRKVRVCQEVES